MEDGQRKKRKNLLMGLDRKKLEILIGGIIVLAMVLVYASTFFGKGKDDAPAENTLGTHDETSLFGQSYQAEEDRLTAILSKINGVGEVKVMITYEGAAEQVPAYNSDSTSQSTSEESAQGVNKTIQNETESKKTVTGQDGTVVLSEKRPQVIGVVIVAQGAENMGVRINLQKAAQTALDVPSNKVEIFTMNQ